MSGLRVTKKTRLRSLVFVLSGSIINSNAIDSYYAKYGFIMGKPKRKPLDRRTGEVLLALFESRPEWKPTEVPWKEIARLGLARPNETISVWASGSSNNPLFMHSIEDIIAGMDVLTHETNPNLAKNEPPGNAYHYVIQKLKNSKHPYMLYGPFDDGTIAPHWFDYEDLDLYPND